MPDQNKYQHLVLQLAKKTKKINSDYKVYNTFVSDDEDREIDKRRKNGHIRACCATNRRPAGLFWLKGWLRMAAAVMET